MKKLIILALSHVGVGLIGFILGIYLLPILTAPEAPTHAELSVVQDQALFHAEFRRDLEDSDVLHWGEGQLSVGQSSISLQGSISPGPNFILYLSPTFVETEADFSAQKSTMVAVGDIKTFDNFVVNVPADIDVTQFNSVIVWCESFGEFITAAQYR